MGEVVFVMKLRVVTMLWFVAEVVDDVWWW